MLRCVTAAGKTLSMSRMDNQYNRIGFLSSSALKLLACIFMTVDHVGLVLFPRCEILRIIGRLAFPIFAFFIAEGSKYSKNKLKRFLSIFLIGAFFLVFYYFFDGSLYGNIFLTFSFSIALDMLVYLCKKELFEKGISFKTVVYLVSLFLSLILSYILFEHMRFEYGFFGMLLPVVVNLTNFRGIKTQKDMSMLDCHPARLMLTALCLIPLCINANMGSIQLYCFFALIPILFYSGKVGCKKMKYIFYIFYPAHLLVIEVLAIVLSYLK